MLRTGLKEMRTNQPWNWRLTVLTNGDDAGQITAEPISRWLSQPTDCTVSACSPLPLPLHPWNSPLKGLAHGLSLGEVDSFEQRVSPPSLATSEIKQIFLFTELPFIGFIYLCIYLLFFFWLHPQHVEVPGPGIKPVPQQ